MTEKTVSRVLVIGADFEGFQHTADGADDLVGFLVLDHTGFYGNQNMGAGLVDAGYDFPLLVAEDGMAFVAIVVRMLHSDDRVDLANAFQQSLDLFLLERQLLVIGHVQHLASTALAGYGAET